MYFEEFQMGQRFQCDSKLITAEEIQSFATKYDPHPIHIDKHFAENHSMFNGIISSGFLTISAMWGQWIRSEVFGNEFLVGKGFDYMKFLKPVRENDILSTEVEVMDLKPNFNQSRGEITIKFTVTNQNDEVVLLAQLKALLRTKASIPSEKTTIL